jgi:eukaryotic translation initiation factor 2C
LELNQFRVKSWSDAMKIYQFDVSVSPQSISPGVIFRKCWEHPDTQAVLATYRTLWLSDGRKLAW